MRLPESGCILREATPIPTSCRTALSRIEAATNIQAFLLKKKYVTASNQNDAIVEDIIRLTDYISDQCKILRKESLFRDDKHSLLCDSADKDSSKVHSILSTSNNHILPRANEEENVISTHIHAWEEDKGESKIGESLSTPVRKSRGESMPATGESPGFDRLLNKILSPSRDTFSVENTTPIPPILIPVLLIEPQQQKQQYQRQNQCYNRNITDEETLDFSISHSTSALLSPNNTRENNDNSHGHDNIMTEEEQGMIYNDISAVVKNEEDDDDDDVFDLLRSVDDWPALKNFVRRKPIINELKDGSNGIECVTKDQQTVEIYREKSHDAQQIVIPSSEKLSKDNTAAVDPSEKVITLTTTHADQQKAPPIPNRDDNATNDNSNCDINIKQQEERNVADSNCLLYNSVVADLNNKNKSTPNKSRYSRSPPTKSPGTKSPSWFNNEKSRSDCPQPLNNHFDLRKSMALAIPKKKAAAPVGVQKIESFLPDS